MKSPSPSLSPPIVKILDLTPPPPPRIIIISSVWHLVHYIFTDQVIAVADPKEYQRNRLQMLCEIPDDMVFQGIHIKELHVRGIDQYCFIWWIFFPFWIRKTEC